MDLLDSLHPIDIAEPITNETPLEQEFLHNLAGYEGLAPTDAIMGEFLSATSQTQFCISGRAYTVKPFLTSAKAKQHFLYVQSVSVLAMDGNYYTNRQSGDSLMLLYTLAGGGRFEYEGKTALLRPGDGVWIDCARAHRYQTVGDEWTHVVVHLCGTSLDAWYDEYASMHPFKFHEGLGGDFQACLEKLIHDYGTISYGREIKIANGISNLLTMLIAHEGETHEDNRGVHDTSGGALDYVQQAVDYLERHLTEPVTLDRLAEHVHLSKYYLSHEFKRMTGLSPLEYLIGLRMNQACLLLATTTLPVARVGELVGIPNGQHFSKQFKGRLGMAPSAYRASLRS